MSSVRKASRVFLVLLLTLGLWGCAESVTLAEAATMTPVGFWDGYFDGVTLLLAMVGTLFDDSIAIYAIYNNGSPYDWGFVLGVGSLGSWSFFGSNSD